MQIVNYLRAMTNVDYDALQPADMPVKGPHGGHESPFSYTAMRRKAYVPDSEVFQ